MKKGLSRLGMGVLVLALVLALAVALVWQPDRSAEELALRWAQSPSQFVPIMGMRVHLRDEGVADDPMPVVLLHGTSASLHTWDGWVRELKQNHRVIRIDLPGFGLTGPFPDNDYSMTHYVAFMAALYDRLELKNTVLAGNSFGGRLAWLTALAEPARVNKLILVDAAGYPFMPSSIPIGFRMAQIPVLSTLIERILPRSMVASSVRNVYGDPDKVTDALVDRYYELTLRAGNRHALVERFRQAPSGKEAEQIPGLKLPTLILWGQKDLLIPMESADHFRRDIKGSTLVVFPELGHVPHEENPPLTVAAVQTFLQ